MAYNKDTYIPGAQYTDQQSQDLTNKIIGGHEFDYRDIFNKGYEKLGQPLNDDSNRDNVINEGTHTLASAFIDQYHKQNNSLPTADQVNEFVGSTLTPEFTSKFITGIPLSTITANYVTPYLQNKKFEDQINSNLSSASGSGDKTNQSLSDIYGKLMDQGSADVGRTFAPLRNRAIEEEAASGRSRSGVSSDPTSAVGQVDANQGNALSSVISNILGQKAAGTLDLTKFNDSLGLAKTQAAMGQNQFNQNLALQKQNYQDQMNLGNKQLDLSAILGKLSAQPKQPTAFDWANLALGGVGTGAKVASLF